MRGPSRSYYSVVERPQRFSCQIWPTDTIERLGRSEPPRARYELAEDSMNLRRQLNVGIARLPGDDFLADAVASLQTADGMCGVGGTGKGSAGFLLGKQKLRREGSGTFLRGADGSASHDFGKGQCRCSIEEQVGNLVRVSRTQTST